MRQICEDQQVRCVIDYTKTRGREVGICYVGGRDIGAEVIAAGNRLGTAQGSRRDAIVQSKNPRQETTLFLGIAPQGDNYLSTVPPPLGLVFILFDTICDIVNSAALAKIKQQLLEMRKSPQGRTADELESIALKLGRVRDKRGKEPTFVRERDPALSPPLSIPKHGGKDIKTGTARNIIDMLIDDVSDWEIYLNEAEDD